MKLFESINIGSLYLKNRFVRSSTWEDLASESGHMTQELFNVYEELAQGGVALIMTGYAHVTAEEQPNPGMMGIYDDSFIRDFAPLTDMVHQNDCAILLQMAYGGSMSNLNPPSPKIWGPSAIKNESTGITPTAMTKEDIEYIKDSFVKGAIRAQNAGFDAVQVHSAHGYMFSHFLSPEYNVRTDEYGGSIENRARLLIETISKIKSSVSIPVLVKLNSEDFTSNGLSAEESLTVCEMLETAGIDAIEVSGGNMSANIVNDNNLGASRRLKKSEGSYFKDYAIKLKNRVNVPVILTGGNRDINLLEELTQKYGVDMFGFSRPLIAEPDLPNLWKEDVAKACKCISCNGCFNTKGKRCVLNMRKK